MGKNLKITRYGRIHAQLNKLFKQTEDPISRMATINALLHFKMPGFFWTGFYLVKNGELLAGPYQGELACQVLEKNKGVCWTAINRRETVIVEDVHKFPGHIACNPGSKSEIVVPVRSKQGEIIGVLDVDSTHLNHFDETDARCLEDIVKLLVD